MSKLDGKCNRCSGRGIRDCAQAHLGVPGLCFDCNGSGSYADQAKERAARRAHKAIEARRRAATQPAYDKIWVVRNNAEALGFPRASREQRTWFRSAGVFSTQAFADAFGLDLRDAWNVLCCSYPKIGLFYDETANKVAGWSADYNA